MEPVRALVWTDPANPAQSDRRFLDRLGGPVNVVSNLVWSTQFPGGDFEATCNLNAPPNFNHIGLTPGRRAAITCGGAIRWHGTLDEPVRGDPWQLHFTGDSSLATQFAAGSFAYGSTIGSAVNPNAFFDDAVGRGLNWTRNGISLGNPAGASTNSAQSFDDALAAYSQATGLFWKLTPSPLGGAAVMQPFAPAPTTPSMILQSTQPLNPTMQGYFTQVVVSYQSGTTIGGQSGVVTTVTVSDAPSIARFGVREGSLDLTSSGNYSNSTAATAAGQAWLAANKPQLRYTTPVTVQPGKLSIPGGGPVDLMTVRAGCMVSVIDVDPSHDSQVAPGPLNMLVGTTSFDATAETLTLTPLGALGQDFESIVYQTAGGAL